MSYLPILAAGLLVYWATLALGIPTPLLSLFSPEDSTLLCLVLLPPLYLAYRLSGWLAILVSFSSSLWLFAAQLSGLWRSASSWSFFLLGGLLPFSDANNYYMSAQSLLAGGNLSVDASGRPLSQGLLATVLALTQQNLQVTLAILGLAIAISCFLLAWEVRRSHGPLAGVAVLMLVFLFDREFLGTAATENLGLALGALGTAALWRGATDRQGSSCLWGIFLLALALNTRAGAFFLLPALIIWAAWLFRGTARFSLSFLLAGTGAALLAFVLNALVFKVIGRPGTAMNANFSYVFYGLVVGGNWQTVRSDHPELLALEEAKQSQRIYELAFAALRARPSVFLGSMVRAWGQFLFGNYLFSFASSAAVSWLGQLFGLASLAACCRRPASPLGSLLLFSAVGVLASVPFAPPWDGGIRVYGATIPLLSLYPTLGFLWFKEKFSSRALLEPTPVAGKKAPKVSIAVATGLTLLLLVGPVAVRFSSHRPQFSAIACPLGQEAAYFRNRAGSSIELLGEGASQRTNVPAVRLEDFRAGLARFQRHYAWVEGIPETVSELAEIDAGKAIFATLNFGNYEGMWLLGDREAIPSKPGIVAACGKFKKVAHGAPLFYAESFDFGF